MSLQLSDLKEAKYNPRVISDKRLGNLAKSMAKYGDLSGVVFNKRTNTLISGHQRLKTLRMAGIKTKIETKKVKDNHGTVAEGYIIAKSEHGELRLPLRVVDWSDKKSEMAANIAANAHGGDFDRDKLGSMLRKLEAGKEFDIDTLGIDPLSLRGLMSKVDTIGGEGEGGTGGESFPEFDEDSFDFKHTCPKCKFQFNNSAASTSSDTPKVNKRVEASKKTLAEKKKKKDAEEKASGKVKKKKKAAAVEAPAKKIKSTKDKPSKKLAKIKKKSKK